MCDNEGGLQGFLFKITIYNFYLKVSVNRLVLYESVAYPFLLMYFLHLNLCTGQKIVSSLEHHVRRVGIFPDTK